MRSLLIIIYLLLFTVASAQDLSPELVEKQTYDSFVIQDYKTTIKLGALALKQGIDSYYLRYRLGISYFEKQNYEAAIPHLEMAKSLDSNDPILLEYLYYAYVYSNRNEKATLLTAIFPDDLKAKLSSKPMFFKTIAVEIGVLKTSNFDDFKKANIKGTNNFAQGEFYSDVSFANLLITNQLSPKFKLLNAISLVSNTSNMLYQFTLPNKKTQLFTDNNNYLQWNSIAFYYLKGWNIGAGAGIYNSSYISYIVPPPFPINTPFTRTKTSNTNYSASLSIKKRFQYLEPTIGISYTNLSHLKTISAEASLTYFPFGNSKFYGNSKFAFVSNEFENNSIYSQLLGLKLAKKVWIEVYGAYGNHQNYVSENGLFVFNTPNKINWYTGSNLNFYFKKFDFSLGYGIQERAATYENGANPTAIQRATNYTYNYNLLKTKIVWKF